MGRKAWVRLAVLAIAGLLLLAILTRGGAGPQIEPGSTLLIDVSGEYVEAPAAPLLQRLLGDARPPFAGLLSTMALARRDARIETVVLRIRGTQIGWGKAQEIRDAIGKLRAAGKKTLAYLELATFSASRDYYIAAAAEQVVVAPGSLVPVLGLAAEYLFLGGVWEKIGLEVEAERIGRYKSAVDSYTGTHMTDSHREMANSLLDSVNAQFLGGIAESRDMDLETVRSAIDAGPVTPDQLVSLGLADRSVHLEDLSAMDGSVVRADDYMAVDPSSVGFEPEAAFALVYGTGPVVTGGGRRSPSSGPQFASDDVSQALRDAAADPEIDAIILRIDSPGGSSLASEVIWKAMQDARREGKKPLIASLSDVAASGGYYVAVGADSIVADPGGLTGSIGVFVLRPVLGGVFEKLGISVESLTRGAQADFLLSAEPLSPGARERLQTLVLDTYDLFLTRVADGRELSREEVDELGQGRVWTGEQAHQRGLVDELGGLHDAVGVGRRALGLAEDADVMLVPYPPPATLADSLNDLLRGESMGLAAPLPLPDALRKLEQLLMLLPARTPLLIPPFLVDIH